MHTHNPSYSHFSSRVRTTKYGKGQGGEYLHKTLYGITKIHGNVSRKTDCRKEKDGSKKAKQKEKDCKKGKRQDGKKKKRKKGKTKTPRKTAKKKKKTTRKNGSTLWYITLLGKRVFGNALECSCVL